MSFDFSEIRDTNSDLWLSLVDTNKPFNEYIVELFDLFVYLDEPCSSIALAAILTPSVLSQRLPILFCYGKKGTGKSTLGKFAAKLYDCECFQARSTFASIRTHLDNMRYPVDEENPLEKPNEQLAILTWDDISVSQILDESMYSLFKSGYDRDTEVISVMGGVDSTTGRREIIKYKTFSTKVISSTQAFHTHEEMHELQRRMLVIPSTVIPEDREILDMEDYSFAGLDLYNHEFWVENAKRFVELKKTEKRKIDKWLKFAPKHRIVTLFDVYITGKLLGFWDDFSVLVDHDIYVKRRTEESSDTLTELLKTVLNGFKEGVVVPVKVLREVQQEYAKQGFLSTKESSVEHLKSCMIKQGYTLTLKGWEKEQ